MDNIQVKSAWEVFMQSVTDSTEIYFLGINNKSDLNQKMNIETLRGGLYNVPVGFLKTNKEMDYSVEPLFFNESVLSILSGSTSASGTITVKAFEQLPVASGKVTVVGTPSGSTADVYDSKNKHYAGAIATKVVTITSPPADGTLVTVVYDTSVTGDITDFNVTDYPQSFKIYAHTVAYSPNSDTIVSDIYLYLPNVSSDGNLALAFENAKNNSTPLKFIVIPGVNSTSFGKYISVPRA